MVLCGPADDGQDYYDDSASGASPTHHEAVFDVEEFDEIYANYAEARGKLNALRTARGFYPVVAMVNKPLAMMVVKRVMPQAETQKEKVKPNSCRTSH